jgi:hypothetical protein
MKRQFVISLAAILVMTPYLLAQGASDRSVSSSGNSFLVPQKQINGAWVGQEDALIEEVRVSHEGRLYRRLDVGVSGSLSGWVVKEGSRLNHFVSAPEFAFT